MENSNTHLMLTVLKAKDWIAALLGVITAIIIFKTVIQNERFTKVLDVRRPPTRN